MKLARRRFYSRPLSNHIGASESAASMESGIDKISPEARQSIQRASDELQRSLSKPVDAFQIIPNECAILRPPVSMVGQIPPNTPFAVAMPFVPGVTNEIAQVALSQIYGDGVGGSALSEVIAQKILGRTITAVPTIVVSGWMPDPNNVPGGGTIWMGLQFAQPISVIVGQRVVRDILISAYSKAGISTGAVTGSVIQSSGDSDQAFQAAAMASTAEAARALEALLIVVGLRDRITRDSKTMADAFSLNVDAVANGATAFVSAPMMIAQVDPMVESALDAPESQAQETVRSLSAFRMQLESIKSKIQTGVSALPAFEVELAAKDDPSGSLAMKLRNEIIADVRSEIGRINVAAAREYRECLYYSQAQRSLDSLLKKIAESFAKGEASAAVLRNNSDAINQVIAGIDAAVAKLKKAEEEVPLSWLMRDFHGAPMWVWISGGSAIAVGGYALVIMRIRKNRLASSSSK